MTQGRLVQICAWLPHRARHLSSLLLRPAPRQVPVALPFACVVWISIRSTSTHLLYLRTGRILTHVGRGGYFVASVSIYPHAFEVLFLVQVRTRKPGACRADGSSNGSFSHPEKQTGPRKVPFSLALHPGRCEPIRGKFIVRFAPPRPKRPPAQQHEKKEPSAVRYLALAREMKALMEAEGINQAEIARRYALTRARVCQLMALLKLPADVLADVDRLAEQRLGARYLTERRVRMTRASSPRRRIDRGASA